MADEVSVLKKQLAEERAAKEALEKFKREKLVQLKQLTEEAIEKTKAKLMEEIKILKEDKKAIEISLQNQEALNKELMTKNIAGGSSKEEGKLQAELKSARAEVEKLQSEKRALQDRMEELRRDTEIAQKRNLSLEQLQNENAQMKKELQELRKTNFSTESGNETQIAQLKQRLKEADDATFEKERFIVKLQQELDQTKEVLEGSKKKKGFLSKKDKKDKTEQRNSSSPSDKKDRKEEKPKEQKANEDKDHLISDLRDKLSMVEKNRDELLAVNKSLEAAMTTMEDSFTSLNEELQKLKQKSGKTNSETLELEATKRMLQTEAEKRKVAEEKAKDMETKWNTSELEVMEKQEVLEKLYEELTSLKSTKANPTQDMKENPQFIQLSNLVEKIKSDWQSIQTENTQRKSLLLLLQDKIAKMTADFQEEFNLRQSREKALTELQNSLLSGKETEETLQKRQLQIEQLQLEIQEKDRELNKLEVNLKSKEQELEKSEAKVVSLNQKLSDLAVKETANLSSGESHQLLQRLEQANQQLDKERADFQIQKSSMTRLVEQHAEEKKILEKQLQQIKLNQGMTGEFKKEPTQLTGHAKTWNIELESKKNALLNIFVEHEQARKQILNELHALREGLSQEQILLEEASSALNIQQIENDSTSEITTMNHYLQEFENALLTSYSPSSNYEEKLKQQEQSLASSESALIQLKQEKQELEVQFRAIEERLNKQNEITIGKEKKMEELLEDKRQLEFQVLELQKELKVATKKSVEEFESHNSIQKSLEEKIREFKEQLYLIEEKKQQQNFDGNQSLELEVKKLKQQLAAANKEILAHELSRKDEINQLRYELDLAREELSQVGEIREKLTRETQTKLKLEQDISELKNKLEQVQLQKERTLKEFEERLKDQKLANMVTAAEEINQYREQDETAGLKQQELVTQLQKELHTIKGQLRHEIDLNASHQKQYLAEVLQLRDDLERSRARLMEEEQRWVDLNIQQLKLEEEVKKYKKSLIAETSDYSGRLSSLEEETRILKIKVKEEKSKCDQFESQNVELQEELLKLRSQLKRAEALNSSLHEEFSTRKDSTEQSKGILQQTLNENQRLEETLKAKQQEIEQLKDQAEARFSLERNAMRLEFRLKEAADWQQKQEEHTTKLEKEAKVLREKCKEEETKRILAGEQKQMLEEEVWRSKLKLEEAELAFSKQEEELKRVKQKLNQEETLRAEATANSEKTKYKMELQLKEQKASNEDKERIEELAKKQKSEISALKEYIAEIGNEKIELKNTLRKLREQLSDLEEQIQLKEAANIKGIDTQKKLETSMMEEFQRESLKRAKLEEVNRELLKDLEEAKKKIDKQFQDQLEMENHKNELKIESEKAWKKAKLESELRIEAEKKLKTFQDTESTQKVSFKLQIAEDAQKRLEMQNELLKIKIDKETSERLKLEESETILKKELIELKAKLVDLLDYL